MGFTGRLFVSDGHREKVVELDDERLEWILNALRSAQDGQLKLAQEATEQGDSGESKLNGPVEDRYISLNEMAREQLEVITKLREEIVEAIGYDLTDG